MAAGAKQEIEIKLAIASAAEARRRLRRGGFARHQARTHEINWLFDDSRHSLRRSGRLLRLRRSGKKWTLTAKTPTSGASKYKIRGECETDVTEGEQCRALLGAIGFRETFVYERYRTEFRASGSGANTGEIVVDETPIGCFLELEGPRRWIGRAAAALGFSARDYLTASYVELFQSYLRKHRLRARNFTFRELRKKRRVRRFTGS
jgi:adenylate cyclase class 2